MNGENPREYGKWENCGAWEKIAENEKIVEKWSFLLKQGQFWNIFKKNTKVAIFANCLGNYYILNILCQKAMHYKISTINYK